MAKSELKGPEPENDAYCDEITIRCRFRVTHHATLYGYGTKSYFEGGVVHKP